MNGAYDPKMKKEVEKIIEKVVIIMMRGKQDEIRVKMCGVITKNPVRIGVRIGPQYHLLVVRGD